MRLSSCCGPVRCALVHPSSPAPVCFISLCCTSLCAAPPLPPSSPVAFPSLQVRCIHLEYRARPHNQALTEAAPPPPPTSLSLFSFHPAILPLCSRASVPAVPFFLCPVCVYLLTAGPPCLPLALASCTAISTTDSCRPPRPLKSVPLHGPTCVHRSKHPVRFAFSSLPQNTRPCVATVLGAVSVLCLRAPKLGSTKSQPLFPSVCVCVPSSGPFVQGPQSSNDSSTLPSSTFHLFHPAFPRPPLHCLPPPALPHLASSCPLLFQ